MPEFSSNLCYLDNHAVFVVRVWVGQQDNFVLLIVMEVHLSGLNVLADKVFTGR